MPGPVARSQQGKIYMYDTYLHIYDSRSASVSLACSQQGNLVRVVHLCHRGWGHRVNLTSRECLCFAMDIFTGVPHVQ
jgi:hypothetical protein